MLMKTRTHRLRAIVTLVLSSALLAATIRDGKTATASGMVTNLASRLCGLGRAGVIHLGEVTASEVAGHFMLYGLEQVQLKHIAGVTPVYRVDSAETLSRHNIFTQTGSA